MKILVCGSRDGVDAETIELVLASRIRDPSTTTVIHGDARGTDRIAAAIGQALGCTVVAYRADWDQFGRRAGILRNLVMLDQRPDLVLAFWNGRSPGTRHTLDEAERRGIPIEVVAI